MLSTDVIDRVLKIIDLDRKDLVELCLKLGNLRDYPGEEREVGEAVVDWFERAGIEAYLQWIDDESVNAVALLRGHGDRASGARSLALNAHMDTQGGVPEGGAEAEQRIRGAWVEGEMLFGRGLANDKAQLCAEMLAARAIKKAGLQLKGDLYVTGVAQETSAPVNVGLGKMEHWSGVGPKVSQVREGHGSRWLIEHGVVADYALVGEVSDFAVTVAEAGYLRLRVAVRGNVLYTPGLRRGPTIAENPNPFERAAHVMIALEEWARRYEKEGQYEFWGGTVVPRAQIYEVGSSGPPWTELEDYCYIYMDVRLVPGANPVEIQHQLEEVIRSVGVECRVTPYDYRRGYIAEGAEPLLEALRAAHRQVLGQELPFAGPQSISMWRDANAFNEAGIPAIGYGPRTHGVPSAGLAGATRSIAVSDLLATAKVFALTALDVCGVHEE